MRDDEPAPPRDGEGDRRAQRGGGGGSASLRRPEVYEARKLRREMSLPEVLLWQRLRRKSTGVKFRHQHPIGLYKADFYCAAHKLVIELDGEIHNRGDQPARDEVRNGSLEALGYRVIRIAAFEVLRNPDEVAASIALLVTGPPPPPRKRGGPPPRKRGGVEL